MILYLLDTFRDKIKRVYDVNVIEYCGALDCCRVYFQKNGIHYMLPKYYKFFIVRND